MYSVMVKRLNILSWQTCSIFSLQIGLEYFILVHMKGSGIFKQSQMVHFIQYILPIIKLEFLFNFKSDLRKRWHLVSLYYLMAFIDYYVCYIHVYILPNDHTIRRMCDPVYGISCYSSLWPLVMLEARQVQSMFGD